MAEEKKVVEAKEEVTETVPNMPEEAKPATVTREDFETLVSQYNRLGLAFKKLVDFCSHKYADELITNVFADTDKELAKEAKK